MLSVKYLDLLSSDRTWSVRLEVAAFDGCPDSTLRALLEHSSERQRTELAGWLPDGRPTSHRLHELLCEDESVLVRCSVADAIDRHKVKRNLIKRLMKDPSPEVRGKVASMKRVTGRELKVLAGDPDEGIKAVAMERLESARQLKQRSAGPSGLSEFERERLAEQLETPTMLLEGLASDDSERVRKAVARNWNTPKDTRYWLATEGGVLFASLEQPTQAILLYAARNGNEEARAKAARAIGLSTEAMTILSSDKSENVRTALASSKYVSPSILESLSHDESEAVRLAVASNYLTPGEVLARLEEEKERLEKERSLFYEEREAILAHQASFDASRHVFTLKIDVPPAPRLYEWFARDQYPPSTDPTAKAREAKEDDERLLLTVEDYLKDGDFVLDLWGFPEEVVEDLELGQVKNMDPNLVGSWSHKRAGRRLTLTWHPPNCLERPVDYDPEELERAYRDWFMDSAWD